MWNEAAMVDAGLKIMECWKLQTKSINCRLKTGEENLSKSVCTMQAESSLVLRNEGDLVDISSLI